MNRRTFLEKTALQATAALSIPFVPVAFSQAAHNAPGENSNPHSESTRRIEKATAAAMAMQRRDWEQGILAQAMLEAGDRERVILLTNCAIVQRTPDGRLGVVVSGSPTDPAMGGPAYAQAAEWTSDPRIREAVNGLLSWIRVGAPRNSEGILYHVFNAPEMWSDGLNGAPPFLAAMGHYDEALFQIEGYRKRLWNSEKRLLAHIWDDGKKQFKDGNFWGGGNGWAAAGLARVIRSLPRDRRQHREHLAAFATEIIDGCLKHQRSDGLFHNVVDQPSSFVETNLAQMLSYAIYEGIAEGWLPATYRESANTMRAAARAKLDSFGFVQGVCSAPYFDRPGVSTEGQAFCIMMEAAGARLESADPVLASSRARITVC
jgi:rhamnogalacturonyl hydrolase YesR